MTELAKSILETASAWQQENLQLSYIIGNTEKAHSLMLKLNELAGRSPFKREELAAYAKQLINFGFSVDEITPLMSRLSNIAVVLGKDSIPLITESLARMKQRGYADARVMMELFHAGIPIQDELAKRFGVTTFQMNKLIQEGRVGFRDVYDALTALTTGSGQMAGATDKWTRTIEGRWHALSAVFEELKTSLGRAVLPALEKIVGAFRDWLDVNKGHLADDMIKLLNTIAYVLGWIVGRVTDLLISIGVLPDPNKKVGPGQADPTKTAYGADKVLSGMTGEHTGILPTTLKVLDNIFSDGGFLDRLVQKAGGKGRADWAERSLKVGSTDYSQGTGIYGKGLFENANIPITININHSGTVGSLADEQRLGKTVADGVSDGLKKAIRQAAPQFAGGLAVTK